MTWGGRRRRRSGGGDSGSSGEVRIALEICPIVGETWIMGKNKGCQSIAEGESYCLLASSTFYAWFTGFPFLQNVNLPS